VPRVGLKVKSKATRSGCIIPRSREAGADASGFDSATYSSDALGLVQRHRIGEDNKCIEEIAYQVNFHPA
jgi:hypothetical protein